MPTSMPVADNPFVDPISESEEEIHDHGLAINATLAVGRDASLTLGTDSLIVLDEAYRKRDTSNFCGILQTGSATTRAIPYYNVLWAELSYLEVTIHYANPVAKEVVRASFLHYTIEKTDRLSAISWTKRLLDRAYGKSQRQKRAKVLVNPHSGKGSAEKWYCRDVEPIFAAARCSIDMTKTKYRGEAAEVAEGIDTEKYDMIVCCSGDGLPYEVFNGLGKRADARKALSKMAVVNIPCGSGNAMSCNLNGSSSPSVAALAIVKGLPTPLDLISITQGNTRTLSFLSQSVGIIAESDLATEHLRWLGPMRFTYGILTRIFRKQLYPCDIAVKVAIDDKASIKDHYRRELANKEPASARRGNRPMVDDSASEVSASEDGLPPLRYGSVNDKLPQSWETVPHDRLGNFYCGNMAYMAADTNFFAPALPNDGFMDLVTVNGDISRLTALRMLAAVDNGKFFDIPVVTYRKVLGYRIIPKCKGDGYISIDGERVPFQPFQAEVHRGLGTVLSKNGHVYEAPGPL